MKRKILTEETTVTGPNFWGRPSKITFKPSKYSGWYLRTKNKGDVRMDFNIVLSKKGRLQARAGGTELNVLEHIMALKFLIGLDNVILIPDGPWPPYLGGAGGYAKQLKDFLWQTGADFDIIEPKQDAIIKLNNGLETEVSIKKSPTKQLSITLRSHWKPLLPHQQTVVIGKGELTGVWKDILEAKPQGFPGHRKYFADLASIFGWPNKRYVSWVSDFKNPNDSSYAWWCHAVQDTLGALALCHYREIPVLQNLRCCAGHKQDLEAIKQAFS